MKKHFSLACLYLLLSILNTSASVEVRSTHMTTTDGLANNSVCYVFQDSKGFIWMGTLNGLSRYDGNTFVTLLPEGDTQPGRLSLSSNHVRSISEDRNGFLWLETSGEFFNCYDLKAERFVDFTGRGEYRQHYDRKAEAPNGDIWLWNSRNGCRLITYHNGAFSSVAYKKSNGNLPSDSVAYVYPDPHGNIWIGTDHGVALVSSAQTVIVDNNNAFAAQNFGKDVFFLSTDGIINRKSGTAPTAKAASPCMAHSVCKTSGSSLPTPAVICST